MPETPKLTPYDPVQISERYFNVDPVKPSFDKQAETQLAERFPHFSDREAAKVVIAKAAEKMLNADARMNEKIKALESKPSADLRPRGFTGQSEQPAAKKQATDRCKRERDRIEATREKMLQGITKKREGIYAETLKSMFNRDRERSKDDGKER